MAKEKNAVIVALMESHLRAEIKDAEIQMEGFNIFRADRTEGMRKGGVIIYIREDLCTEVIVSSSGSNGVVEWLTLLLKPQNIVFTCLYRPPSCNKTKFDEVLNNIAGEVDAIGPPNPNQNICDDFNLPIIKWRQRMASYLEGPWRCKAKPSPSKALWTSIFWNN